MADASKIQLAYTGKGPRENILRDLAESALSAENKQFLTALIAAKPWDGVTVHFHDQPHEADHFIHLHLKKLY